MVHTSVLVGLAILFVAQSEAPDLPGDEAARSVEIAVISNPTAVNQPFQNDSQADQPPSESSASAINRPAPPSPFPVEEASTKPLTSGVLPVIESVSNVSSGELLPGLVDSQGGVAGISSNFDEEAFIKREQEALRRSSGPKGPVAETSLFGSRISGRSFIFLLDTSKSMGGEGLGAIEAAEKELIQALDRLDQRQKFQIVAYNQRPAYLQPNLTPASDDQKSAAAKFLGGIVAFGGTEHYAALQASLRQKPEVIVVLSDGGDPELTSAMLRQITVRSGSRTTIHCIHFGERQRSSEENEHFLEKLARLNRGTYVYINMSRR